jgi:hypothetical protein
MAQHFPGVGEVIDHVNLSEVLVVAFRDQMGQWAAYIGPALNASHADNVRYIASSGHKLYEKEARAFFPQLKNEPYRR